MYQEYHVFPIFPFFHRRFFMVVILSLLQYCMLNVRGMEGRQLVFQWIHPQTKICHIRIGWERTVSHSELLNFFFFLELLNFDLDTVTGQPRMGVSVFRRQGGGRVHKIFTCNLCSLFYTVELLLEESESTRNYIVQLIYIQMSHLNQL